MKSLHTGTGGITSAQVDPNLKPEEVFSEDPLDIFAGTVRKLEVVGNFLTDFLNEGGALDAFLVVVEGVAHDQDEQERQAKESDDLNI
jgi:hypothetical protein